MGNLPLFVPLHCLLSCPLAPWATLQSALHPVTATALSTLTLYSACISTSCIRVKNQINKSIIIGASSSSSSTKKTSCSKKNSNGPISLLMSGAEQLLISLKNISCSKINQNISPQVRGGAAAMEVDKHKPRFLSQDRLQEGQGQSACHHHTQVCCLL